MSIQRGDNLVRNTCPKCGARIETDDAFCPDCGAKIISKEVKEEKPAILGVIRSPDSAHNRCSKCRAKISEDLKFCPKCGIKQIANCPKCGAKLNKTDDFCTGCGFKMRKPATFASNSLTYGIFALLVGWVPFFGWLLIFLALLYGFLSLRRIKKGNTLENKKVAVAGIILGFISLAITFCVVIYYIQGMNAPISGASATNENGMVTLTIYGKDVPLRFVDETTGMPVSGLSVGYSIYGTKGEGALLIIDPKKRFSPQIVLLEGSKTNKITGDATSELEVEILKDVFVTKEPATLIQTIRLEQLREAIGTVQDITSAIVLAAKVLDQSGLPVGDYAGKLSIAKQRTISQEEAYVENSIKNKLKEQLIFLAGESVLTKKGAIPNLEPVSVSLDVAHFIVDQFAISSCGAPNEKVLVTEIAGMAILGCQHMYISDYIPQVMTVHIEGKDQYGLKLSDEDSTKFVKGSVDFVSKSNIGFGSKFDLSINEDVKVEVPEGNYATRVTSPGFAPSTSDVNKRGANLRPTLKPIKMLNPKGPISFQPETLPPATAGEEYSWSLCQPDLTRTSDLCGAFIDTTNPTGGMPPYHFQPDMMGGFPPFGINWNLNGMLTGTPTTEGQRTFRMCAVDMAGSQSCQTLTLNVKPKPEEPKELKQEPKKQSGNGCFCSWTNEPCTKNSDCPPDTSVPGTSVPGFCGCPA